MKSSNLYTVEILFLGIESRSRKKHREKQLISIFLRMSSPQMLSLVSNIQIQLESEFWGHMVLWLASGFNNYPQFYGWRVWFTFISTIYFEAKRISPIWFFGWLAATAGSWSGWVLAAMQLQLENLEQREKIMEPRVLGPWPWDLRNKNIQFVSICQELWSSKIANSGHLITFLITMVDD